MDKRNGPLETSDTSKVIDSENTTARADEQPPLTNRILLFLRGYYQMGKEWLVGRKISRRDKWAIAVCFLMAVTVWLYVMSTNDTGYEHSLNSVTVSIVGNDALKNQNLSMISGFDNLVSVTFKGKRADIAGLSASEIHAYIDLSDITEPGQYTRPVKIEVPQNATLVSIEPSSLMVSVDVNSERVIKIDVMLEYVIDASYTLGELKPNYTSVTVTGPKSVLDTIAYAAVKSDIGTIKSSQKLSGKVALYDAYNKVIDNPYLKVSVTEVTVDVPVTVRKTVPLVIDIVGGNYNMYDLTLSPAEVTIIGDPTIVANIEKITVYTINNEDYAVGDQKIMYISDLDLPEGVIPSESYKGVSIVIMRKQ